MYLWNSITEGHFEGKGCWEEWTFYIKMAQNGPVCYCFSERDNTQFK